MSRVPRWGRGNRRRIALITWTRMEVFSAVVLAFSLFLLGFFVARWLAQMEIDEHETDTSHMTSTP